MTPSRPSATGRSASSSRASTCCPGPPPWRTWSCPLIYRDEGGIRAKAAAALASVGLADREHHKPTELSGGQQQRVATARALVTDPAILMADEPTGNLDTKASEEIMALFGQLHRQGRTIVLVTHEPDVARHAERTIHLKDGQVVWESRSEEVPVAAGTGGRA